MKKYSATVEKGIDGMREMAKGNFDLSWMDSNPEGWGQEVERSADGLRLVNIEKGHYAKVPEYGSTHGSMAPRGCYVPDETPGLDQYTLNEMSEVWSENAATFPSSEWFTALAKTMGEDRVSFELLGSVDCAMVVQLTDSPELYEVVFRSHGVESVRSLECIDDAQAEHFTITATKDIWQEMIDNIIENGKPDLEHTLNFLTFPDDPMVVDGPDQLQIDTFFRYNQSLQLFFNGAARVV